MKSGQTIAAENVNIESARLTSAVAKVFAELGLPTKAAELAAEDLVTADLEGIGSHGVMPVPMYVDRLLPGSVSRRTSGEIVRDRNTAIVIDAGNALGQLTARQGVELVVSQAKQLGTGIVAVRNAFVAVRNAFHFGTAGRYARLIADQGCVGIVMSNTRPLMPAPGGAEAMVGNNPLAIALPTTGQHPVEVDMALSATAMGKIRLAPSAGQTIPTGWAVDAQGRPTTDLAAAIKGMLLPAAGPKGFGLAFVIDLLCGGLSDGAIGAEVRPLYGDPVTAVSMQSVLPCDRRQPLSSNRNLRRTREWSGRTGEQLQTRSGRVAHLCAGRARARGQLCQRWDLRTQPTDAKKVWLPPKRQA